jgi:hypothetical protein
VDNGFNLAVLKAAVQGYNKPGEYCIEISANKNFEDCNASQDSIINWQTEGFTTVRIRN